MKTCPKCGGTCEDHYIFCNSCGYKFKTVANTADNSDPNDTSAASKSQQPLESQQPYQSTFEQIKQQPYQSTFQQGSRQPYQSTPKQNSQLPYCRTYQQNSRQSNGYQPQQNSQPPFQSQEPHNNPLSIASLVLGILSVFFICLYLTGLVPAILAIVFGAMSRSSIKKSNGKEAGMSMSTAGLVLGIVTVSIAVIAIIVMVIFGLSLASLYTADGGKNFTSGYSA